MNHKHEALWLLKKCMLHTLFTLILSNLFHLTIGSSLTLIQMNFEFPNVVMHILNFIFLCLEFSKNAIKILTYCIPIILIHHFFWVKSGE
jgi:hypothetical protein